MDYSPPGSSVHGIFQAKILEWVAISSSRGSSHPIKLKSLESFALAGGFFTTSITWEATTDRSEVTQPCLTLYDPIYCSQPGSPAYYIFQARILEWVAISSSRFVGCYCSNDSFQNIILTVWASSGSSSQEEIHV